MKIVVDTNILFSALLNKSSAIHELIFYPRAFHFYAPELLIREIERYTEKIQQFSRLQKSEIVEAKFRLLDNVKVISEELISPGSWSKAYDLVKDIDEYDTPFVALALQLDCFLWTGDKKLSAGLRMNDAVKVLSTQEMMDLRDLMDS